MLQRLGLGRHVGSGQRSSVDRIGISGTRLACRNGRQTLMKCLAVAAVYAAIASVSSCCLSLSLCLVFCRACGL